MGLTKSVHPYCKLAIITMQMMPKISCPQRVASEAAARDEIACVVLIVTASSLPPRHPFAALSSFQIPPGLPVPRKARHSIELSNGRRSPADANKAWEGGRMSAAIGAY